MMNTYQVTEPVLDGYINEKLGEERINFLTTQANEQLTEFSQHTELYEEALEEVSAPKEVDNIILWILLMSNEYVCRDYISACEKDFRKIIPVSDLADLLLYAVYMKKIKETELDGFDYLMEYEEDGMEEVDQFAFTNIFLYIQQSKEVQIEF